ncbi:threonylcarbamoyl-AMP synthase [Gammaproteobacteria bacterium]
MAYPTEAVYGLGCDPRNQISVGQLLALKGRAKSKGLILIASSYEQLEPYLAPVEEKVLERCLATWPGPVTWILPANPDVPFWLTGGRDTLAVRVTAHSLSSALCRVVGHPLVSTSANLSGHRPLKGPLAIRRIFGKKIRLVLHGALGGANCPTAIRDARTGATLRS